ncbi:MAG: hypothetical protein Q7T29_10480 [Gallionella sp.]|nr:hypothetical protein [Gallionella sp.]
MPTEVLEKPAKTAVRIGWGLLATALAVPLIMAATGFISAFKCGELIVQVGFAWLVAAVVIDIILKKREVLTKAKGRIVAAALALVMAFGAGITSYQDTHRVNEAKKELIEQFMASTIEGNRATARAPSVAEPASSATVATIASQTPVVPAPPPVKVEAGGNEADRAVVLYGQMKVRAKKMAEDFAALDRKFIATDLGAVLKPDNMVTREGIRNSRKKVETFKSLINQRNTILQQHFSTSEKIIRDSGLSERETNDALAGLNSSKGSILQSYADLGKAQLDSLKIISGLLNFGERTLGHTSLKDGQIVFQTQTDFDEYMRFIQQITDSSAKEEIATQKISAQAQQHKQNLVDEYKK